MERRNYKETGFLDAVAEVAITGNDLFLLSAESIGRISVYECPIFFGKTRCYACREALEFV